jgi:hypothetical protein
MYVPSAGRLFCTLQVGGETGNRQINEQSRDGKIGMFDKMRSLFEGRAKKVRDTKILSKKTKKSQKRC